MVMLMVIALTSQIHCFCLLLTFFLFLESTSKLVDLAVRTNEVTWGLDRKVWVKTLLVIGLVTLLLGTGH